MNTDSQISLDEATSNLDSETEREIEAVFEQEKKGRTMVMVMVVH